MKPLGPDWVAAIALSIQALIFLLQAAILWWQGRILRRHASTLEKHTEIAGAQAETAKLIGQALDQQGKVTDAQVKIMAAQFEFQRAIEAKSDRERVFDAALELRATLAGLKGVLGRPQAPGSTLSTQAGDEIASAWNRLKKATFPCQKALLTSAHLSNGQREYFTRFVIEVAGLQGTNNFVKDLENVKILEDKYDQTIFGLMLSGITESATAS
jgi:hypothetical protein